MVETIEVEVSDPVAEMLDELRTEYGDDAVDADLRTAVETAIWEGYRQMRD